MRNYSVSNPAEEETYEEYKNRKEKDWNDRIKSIMIEIKDSSLTQDDKDRMQLEFMRMLLR